MDAIRFLNFLHDFAANSTQKTNTNATGGGKTPPANLADTFTAFESQLRALMNTGESAAPTASTSTSTSAATAAAAAASPSTSTEFVIGGGSQSITDLDKSLAATEAMLAMVSERNLSAPTPSSTTASTTPSAENDELKEIIAWRREQIDQMLHVKVGDLWDRQGITDPFNHPKLLADAQQSQEVALFRKAHMPGFVAQWEGDWRTQLSSERQTNELRRIELAAASAASGFTTGGGTA
ncbi:hypothetical protein B9Z49_20190 [Limnohabitans sp. 2KL-51]|nr:hypothetical protein B9Z49_20190 [Limnohabitans sp. 2KL-51]